MFSWLIQNDFVLVGFVVAVPLVLTALAVAGFFAVGALFDALDDQEALKQRIDAFFRRPPREPAMADRRHYYRPFWVR